MQEHVSTVAGAIAQTSILHHPKQVYRAMVSLTPVAIKLLDSDGLQVGSMLTCYSLQQAQLAAKLGCSSSAQTLPLET
jgi:hypothetical protein